MSSAACFGGDYAPGGLTTQAKQRALARRNGRKGGLASGVKRRQLARGRRLPRRRTRHEALSLAYRHRQLTQAELYRRYELEWPRPERPTAAVAWEKGRETLWEHYRSVFTGFRAQGQHYRTTNGQRGAALALRGRPRSRRTVQRLNRKLDLLGVAHVGHYKDQGARPGHKDCLVVEIRTPSKLHVTPLLRSSGNPPEGREVPTATATSTTSVPPTSSAMPPDGGDQRQAPPAPGTEKGELAAQIEFLQLKLELWGPNAKAQAKLHHLRAQARLARESLRPARRGSDARCNER